MQPPPRAAIILLAGSLLAGLGFCALLPPFDGFDETAHYSYIQQIAQTHTWPRLNDPIAADVDDYLQVAPSAIALKARWSYPAFFKASADTVRGGAAAIHSERDPARQWRTGTSNNWEGQHPPLYYVMLAPVWFVSKGWSIYAQIVLLRAVSYLFAWGGLVIATFSNAQSSSMWPKNPVLMIGPALWPALFPMWFPEMARLGNDSLVLALLALAVLVTRKAFEPSGNNFHFVLLGMICGFGLLTKVTMLPFVAALGLFLIWRTWCARGDAAAMRASASQLAVFCLVTVAIAGWWYANNFIAYGNIVGSNDAIELAHEGGLLKGLDKNFSLPLFIHSIGSIIVSFFWAGTWSGVYPPPVTEIPMMVLLCILAANWVWHTTSARESSNLEAIALLTLVLFIVALLHHTLILIALRHTYLPAWYVHSLAPLLAPIVARGLGQATSWRRMQPFVGAIVFYSVLFLPLATALLLFYFAGCFNEPSDISHFGLTVVASCVVIPREIFSKLSVFGDPGLAIPLFSAGWLAMLIGVGFVIKRHFFVPEVGKIT